VKFLVATKSISVRDLRRWKFLCFTAILLGTFLVASSSSAGYITLVDSFAPLPPSPHVYEMIWNGSELYEGPGAIGTGFGTGGPGDGQQPMNLQFVPGLLVQTPFVIHGILGSVINLVSLPNSTAFFDATLDIIPVGGAHWGIPATGPATITNLGSGISVILQPLGRAAFEIWSTDPVEASGDVENPVLLLAGMIEKAAITSFFGTPVGAVLSADVTYTGGAILDAAGFDEVKGGFSWTLLSTPIFSVNPVTKYLAAFEANATGQFYAVPEPGTLALLCIGGLGLAGYAWRKRR